MIINKVELDKFITLCLSFVSQYSQINAKKVVRGIDIIIPAKKHDRFAISATKTTTTAVTKILVIKYNMLIHLSQP